MIGEPDAGNPHVRFDEGVQETCDTRGAPAPYSTRVPKLSCVSDTNKQDAEYGPLSNGRKLMRIAHVLGLLIGAMVGDSTFAANFAMVATGAFGEPLTECRVEGFRPTGTGAKHASDYKERFRGLVASESSGW